MRKNILRVNIAFASYEGTETAPFLAEFLGPKVALDAGLNASSGVSWKARFGGRPENSILCGTGCWRGVRTPVAPNDTSPDAPPTFCGDPRALLAMRCEMCGPDASQLGFKERVRGVSVVPIR
jgi:hypothetical protein